MIANFIDGAFVRAEGARCFDKRSPVDGRLIARVAEAGKEQVDAAVQAARAALHGEWGRMDAPKRAELLYAVADEINRRFDEFLEAEVADTGKPMSLARHLDIPRGAANFKVFADTVKNAATEAFQMHTPDGKGALNYAIRVPKGVVAVICPWNLPLLLMTWKVGPALACGNTVVVKPSEETPSTAALLGEVMNRVGMPKGVYNVVHGFGPDSAGEYLTRHPGVNAITFTGETRTGAAIMKAAADGSRAVSMLRHATAETSARKLYLFYGNRRPEDAAFLDELRELQARNPNYRLIATMAEMEKSRQPWTGETGFIGRDLLARHLVDLAAPAYYIAGPPAMVETMQEMLARAGVDAEDVRTDEFYGY